MRAPPNAVIVTAMMTLTALALAAALQDVTVRAHVADGPIEPGTERTFTVELDVRDGASTGEAGLPAPFLQLDVPPGVTLTEPASTEQHVDRPYERLVEADSVTIPFEVDDALADDATIGVIVTAYVTGASGARFVRERVELPVDGGAASRPGDATDSTWSSPSRVLSIGDRVEPFELPLAEGVEPFDVGVVLGKRPVFLTTYRAHW